MFDKLSNIMVSGKTLSRFVGGRLTSQKLGSDFSALVGMCGFFESQDNQTPVFDVNSEFLACRWDLSWSH